MVRLTKYLFCLLVSLSLLAGLTACEPERIERVRPEAVTPPASFTGPAYMRGSIGSFSSFRGFDPVLVSGYGMVVNLEGTGSAEIPSFLRTRMINYAAQQGIGNTSAGWGEISPERFLRDPNTSIVRVRGLMPPGAAEGTKFDLLVEALPQTQTISLAGGTLWTHDLAVNGDSRSQQFVTPLAKARGSIYTDPFDHESVEDERLAIRREAVVVNGGSVTRRRQIQIILNAPSWFRARSTADRINERYPAAPIDRLPTANAITDQVIDINIPRRWQSDPTEFLVLLQHIFLNTGAGAEETLTQRMINVVRNNPEAAPNAVYVWRVLGRTVVKDLAPLYNSNIPHLQRAAVEAGAYLGDLKTLPALQRLASSRNEDDRILAASLTEYLPQSLGVAQIHRQLIDDEVVAVRVAVYGALAAQADPALLNRFAIVDQLGVKFIIDRISIARKPMIYVAFDQVPRLVVFGPDIPFETPTLARMWNNQLMLRATGENAPLEVFYQPDRGGTKQLAIEPNVATLAYLLGHQTSDDNPQHGFDLTFAEVVDAMNRLVQQGHIDAEFVVAPSRLAEAIERVQRDDEIEFRPEFEELTPEEQEELERVAEERRLQREAELEAQRLGTEIPDRDAGLNLSDDDERFISLDESSTMARPSSDATDAEIEAVWPTEFEAFNTPLDDQ